MNKIEAINAMLKNKKVKRRGWRKNSYIYLDKDGNYVDNVGFKVDLNDYEFEGWKVYEESKQKIDLYLWAVQYEDSPHYGTYHIYCANERELRERVPFKIAKAIRLDYTRITVEED